jgi:predicted DNA-binding ribbon-helix-helix protein
MERRDAQSEVRLDSRTLVTSLIWDSTLENAYSKIIASLANSQQEHSNLADALNVQVVGVLASLARKNEGHRKKARGVLFSHLRCLTRLFSKRNSTRRSWRIGTVSIVIVRKCEIASDILVTGS